MDTAKVAKVAFDGASPRGDGLPSTQELLEELRDSTFYLRDLTRPINPEADLVAVHGLNPVDSKAFALRTWTDGVEGDEKLWLKDFLPHRLPNVRVLLYAYNSNVAFNTSKIGVGDIAEDLLRRLWSKRQVCMDGFSNDRRKADSSLGGLVVKRAIVKARSISRYESISRSAKSYAFFATPHRGGFGAEVGQAGAGILRRLHKNPRTGILEALRKDSHIAPDINNDFVDGQNNYHICTFYECKPMPAMSDLIVEKSSAILGLGLAETRIPCINSNHSTICKFASEDGEYQSIIEEIASLVQWATKMAGVQLIPEELHAAQSIDDTESEFAYSTVSSGDETLITTLSLDNDNLPSVKRAGTQEDRYARKRTFFLVPYVRNVNFVGQQNVLQMIKQFLSLANEFQNRCAIHGIGGAGKSQIALEISCWYQINYPGQSVFWLQANGADQLRDSMGLIAAHCRLSRSEETRINTLHRLKQWLLDPRNGNWLMIVDNANSADTFSTPLTSGVIHESNPSIRDPMSLGLGLFIPNPPHGKVLFTTNNKLVAETLARGGFVVEVHPMSKQDATDMLSKGLTERPKLEPSSQTNTDSERLAEKLDHLPFALMQAAALMKRNSLGARDYMVLIESDTGSEQDTNTITKAAMLTFRAAFDQIGVQFPPATEVLSVMAFYDSKHIPLSLLRKVHRDDQRTADESLRILQAYSLITTDSENENFDVHRLVQLAMRRRLSIGGVEKKWACKALLTLSEDYPDGEFGSWEACAVLAPHALSILHSKLYGSDEALPLGILQAKVSWHYFQQGLYDQAEHWNRYALDNLSLSPLTKQEDVMVAKSNRAYILSRLGRFDEGEDLAQELMEHRQTAEDKLRNMATLSLSYQEQGRYLKAEVVSRRLLKKAEKSPNASEIDILQAKMRLSIVLFYIDACSESKKYGTEAMRGIQNCLGAHHPLTLKASKCLARVLHALGEYAEAERLAFDTWIIEKEVLGPFHPDTVKTQHELAKVLQAQGRLVAAEAHRREILETSHAQVGHNHYYTFVAASSLASCLVESNASIENPSAERYAEAEELFTFSLTGLEKNMRTDHPETLASRTQVAMVRRLRKKIFPYEIEEYERETLKELKKNVGRSHPFTLKSQDNLARILWIQNDIKAKRAEALKIAKGLLTAREKRFGWSREITWQAADLVVEMLPEGKEKQKLVQKILDARKAYAMGVDEPDKEKAPSKQVEPLES
ncbi:MAG: hypothetical protein MMC33_005700 [Icmadophila ericetorum]|nr:hypothetical protein [Icmadophila ericetorum]